MKQSENIIFLSTTKSFQPGVFALSKNYSPLFISVSQGEWDLSWPVFGGQDQRGVGADYHAGLWQGKSLKDMTSTEKPTPTVPLSTDSKHSQVLQMHILINKHTDTHARVFISTHWCPKPVIPVDWAKEELKACSIPGECFQVARLHSSAPKHTETQPVMQSASQ